MQPRHVASGRRVWKGGTPSQWRPNESPGAKRNVTRYIAITHSNPECRIPLFGDFGLANQIGTTDYSRPRRFRAIVEQWLETIRALWPQCPARISGDGQAILLKHAPAMLPAKMA